MNDLKVSTVNASLHGPGNATVNVQGQLNSGSTRSAGNAARVVMVDRSGVRESSRN